MGKRIVTAVKQRFSIRKLSVGAASVLLGTSLYFMGNTQIVHADTMPGTSETGVHAESVSGESGQEKGSTEEKDPVDVARDPEKDDTDVNKAIDNYAKEHEKEQQAQGNNIILQPSTDQPEETDSVKDRESKVDNIKKKEIDEKINDAKNNAAEDKKAIAEYETHHGHTDGKNASDFGDQGLSIDDESKASIDEIAVNGQKHVFKNDEESTKLDNIDITHTKNFNNKERSTMGINDNDHSKIIINFHGNYDGKDVTVIYDNLNNSYYSENIDGIIKPIKISKIERTFSNIKISDSPNKFNGGWQSGEYYEPCDGNPQLIVYNDPANGFYYNNIKEVSVKETFYDDKGQEIKFNNPKDANNAWIFVTSLNSDGEEGEGTKNLRQNGVLIEKVKAETSDGKPADIEKIAGSTITNVHGDGWWYSNESNASANDWFHDQNNPYPKWDEKNNRYSFVGAVAIRYQPGMTITYGADDTAWGSHWAFMQTQVISTLNQRVIPYHHIKDKIVLVDPDHPGTPDKPIDTNNPAGPNWPKGSDAVKDVTETIDYKGLPFEKAPVKQTLHFTGKGYLDKVTGKWTDKDGNELENQDNGLTWTLENKQEDKGTFSSVDSPSEEGYDVVSITVGDQTFAKDTADYSKYMDGTTVKNSDKIDHKHANIHISVNYAKIEQNAKLTVIDEDDVREAEPNGHKLGDYNAQGGYKDNIDFGKAQTEIANWLNSGYELDRVDTKDTKLEGKDPSKWVFGGFDSKSDHNQTWTVYLKHGTTTKYEEGQPNQNDDFNKYITRTITYQDTDGKAVEGSPEGKSTYTQTAHFTRTEVIDSVNNRVLGYDTNGDGKVDITKDASGTAWVAKDNSDQFDAVDSKSAQDVGYDKVDRETVGAIKVSADSDNITEKVIYSRKPIVEQGSVTVKVHDDTTDKDLQDYGKASGTQDVGTGFDYDKGSIIKSLTNAGYKVLHPEEIVIPTVITKGDQTITIHVIHTTTTVTPDNPGKPGEPVDSKNPEGPKYPDGTDEYQVKRTGTQIIHYTGAGDKTPADNKQTFIFTREITFDNVTGKIIKVTSWNVESYTFGNVDTPVIPGYHADKAVAGGATVTPDDLNKVITVTYAPDGNPGNTSDHGETPLPDPTPESEVIPDPTPDDQLDSELSSDNNFEKVEAKNKLGKTNPKEVAAYKKERKIIKTKIAKQGHTEIAEPIEDKVTRENNVKVVSDPVENTAAEPKLPQTGEADNSIIGLLGMLLASFAAIFGFDSLHSHDKKHKN